MTPREQLAALAAAVIGLAGLLWLLGPILLPFVLGMAIAYVIDPVVVWLERRGLSRAGAAGLLVGSTFVGGSLGLLLLTPTLLEQTTRLLGWLPDAARSAYANLGPLARRVLATFGVGTTAELPPALQDALRGTAGLAASFAGQMLSQGMALVNVLGLLSVTPLVAYYLLRDWPLVIAEIDGWLPRRHRRVIRLRAREADHVLAAFARGAALVSAALAIFYAVALSLVGLELGLVIGILAGTLSFVPYLGAMVGFGASVGMALYQFWPAWGPVAIVAVIFAVGQVVSDYILTPRLIGDRVGLHPLWVIFGVFAGGALFGFAGMLLAVPVGAVIGVVVRFARHEYKRSTFYLGRPGDERSR